MGDHEIGLEGILKDIITEACRQKSERKKEVESQRENRSAVLDNGV